VHDQRAESVGIGRFGEAEIEECRMNPEHRITGSDRRGSSRSRLLKTGRTYWQNGDSGECCVRNLSETGAQIVVHGPIPNVFDLVIGSGEFRRSCCVVWRNNNRVGVRFVESDAASRTSTSLPPGSQKSVPTRRVPHIGDDR
jgi:PilZ domain